MGKWVLLTGISGTGKSTLVSELAARGLHAVDADAPGMSEEVDAPPNELTGPGHGKDWVWNEERIGEILDDDLPGVSFISGCSPNQGRFYEKFDAVILLTAPPDVIAHRLTHRTNNPFGKAPDELSRVLQIQQEIEPLLRSGADFEVDTSAPLDRVVRTILTTIGLDPG